jgi:hypothetical protein
VSLTSASGPKERIQATARSQTREDDDMTETPPLIRDMGQAKYEKGTSVSGSGLRPGPWTLSAPGGERDRSAPAGPSARGELPLALRALAISGVLVALMANLVMPLLGQATERWLTRRA